MLDMRMVCLLCRGRVAADVDHTVMTFQCTSDGCGHRQALDLQPQ